MATQLSHLPHIKNVKAGMGRWDPMHQAIFEVAFTVPGALADAGFTGEELAILTQQVVNVSGLDILQKVAAASSQKFLGVDVSFLNPVLDSTTAEFQITFNLNIRDGNDAYVLRLFKEWGRLSYDIGNGHRSLKKDYICETMHISEANRDGTVWREVIFKDVFITGLQGLDGLDYASPDARQLQVSFRADYWEEKTSTYEIGTD